VGVKKSDDSRNTDERGYKKMTRQVEFHHGALSAPYEEQANDQGFTLGKERKRLEQLGFSLVYCWIHGVLTDSQYDMGLKKLQKQLVKALKPKEET
jgi:hypothetical protein